MKFTNIKKQYKICLTLLLSITFYGLYLINPDKINDAPQAHLNDFEENRPVTEKENEPVVLKSDATQSKTRRIAKLDSKHTDKINTHQEFIFNGKAYVKGTVTDYYEVPSNDEIKTRITVLVDENHKYKNIRVEEKYRKDQNGEEELVSTHAMVADHVMVKVKPGVSDERVAEIAENHGLKIRSKSYSGKIYLLETPEANVDSITDAIKELSPNDELTIREPDPLVFPTATPNDLNSDLWGLNNTGQTGGTSDADIDAVEAWDISTGSRDIIVGVIDTGVFYFHPDLAANMWTNPNEIPDNGIDDDNNGIIDDYYGADFMNDDGDPIDDDNHGTHCAGTIGAVGNNFTGVVGVNWEVSIMALKFLGPFGGAISDGIDCIDYATEKKVHITNNSWGGGGFSQALKESIEAANTQGSLFIAAAGNDSLNIDYYDGYPASIDVPNVISVAATDHDDQIATFSNYGIKNVDLAAPGVNVLSTTFIGGAYQRLSGTSMAAPHVAGVAALLYAHDNSLVAEEVKSILLATGDLIPDLKDKTSTSKRLNANNALKAVGSRFLSMHESIDGSSLTVNNTLNIEWNSLNISGNVKVELLRQDNTVEHLMTNQHYIGLGEFNWTVPVYIPIGVYKIRVTSLSNPFIYEEKVVFVNAEHFPVSLSGWRPVGAKTFMPSFDDASEGTRSMKSEEITHSQSAAIEYQGQCVSGFVSFDVRVDSEFFYDKFRFYIDGVRQTTVSGQTGWQSFKFNVNAGNRTFQWRYSKDEDTDVGEDMAIFDNVSLPIASNFYDLTVVDGSTGGSYQSSDTVSLVADTPPAGYEFAYWSTTGGGAFEDVYDPTTTFTMPERNTTVTAVFLKSYNLTVENGSGDGTYIEGEKVAIVADDPGSDYLFSYWGTNAGGVFADSSDSTTYFIMPGNDVTVTANYVDVALIRAFVERFYTEMLDRPADPAGLASWTNLLASGYEAGADITRGFIYSSEFQNKVLTDSEFLDILYLTLFDRPADTGGKANWLTSMSGGTSREDVLEGFIASTEFVNLCSTFGILAVHPVEEFVTRFYQQCLERAPELGGLNYWVGHLKPQTRSGADIAVGFIFSTEFSNRSVSNEDFVTILYRAFFNREPDTGGYNHWLNQLNLGATRLSVLDGFLDAQEFVLLCLQYKILARLPGTTSLQTLMATTGKSYKQAQEFVHSVSFGYSSTTITKNTMSYQPTNEAYSGSYNGGGFYLPESHSVEAHLNDGSKVLIYLELGDEKFEFLDDETLRFYYESYEDDWLDKLKLDLISLGYEVEFIRVVDDE